MYGGVSDTLSHASNQTLMKGNKVSSITRSDNIIKGIHTKTPLSTLSYQ
jgi:hypothetical protein